MRNNFLIQIQEFQSLGKGKYRVCFDTGVVCQVYGSEIRGMKLEAEAYISEEQYQLIMKEIVGKRAKKRALHLLEQMDRTEQQLREKLTRAEYPAECIDDAIAYVKSFHYLDDTRYALTYTRYSQEKYSREQIKQKLMAKGIDRQIIGSAIESEYEADESEHIHRLLDKKHYDAEAVDEGESRRVYQYLLRRGFRSNDILKAMKLHRVAVNE